MPDFSVYTTEQVREQAKKVAQTHLSAKKKTLEELLEEIETEGYQTISQVKVSIHSTLKILNMMEKEQS
jgi:glucan biosynthesis protein